MCGEKHVRMAEQCLHVQTLYHMNFLEFSHDIVGNVLTGWLLLSEVARLDSAFCNINDRTHFLNLISSEGFVAKETVIVPHMLNYLGWQVKRKVKTTGVLLNGSLADSYLLFATTIGTHTECIELQGMQNKFADLMAELTGEFRNLKQIKLVQCGNIVGIKSLLKRAESTLQEITIDTCTFDSDAHFGELSFPRMQSLNLTNVRDDGNFLTILCCCPQLQKLALQSVHSTKKVCWRSMSRYTLTLRRLSLSNCDALLSSTAVVDLAQNCPALTDLELGLFSALSDQAVIAFTENCPALDSITLSSSCTDAALTAIATNCGAKLCCLSITRYGGETGLNALINYCPNLRSFKASHLYSTELEMLICFISSMPELEEVALQYSDLSDAVLDAVASCGEKLLHLDLSSSRNFSSVGLASVAFSCPNLQTLYFTYGGMFGIHDICEGMLMLWYLSNPKIRFNSPNWTTPPYWKR